MVSLESSPARRPAVGNDERERDHHYRVVAGLRSIFTNSAQPNPPINAPNGVRNNHGIGFLSIGFRESRIVLLNSSQGLYFYQHFRSGLQTCDARLVGNLFPLSSGGRGYNPRSIPCEWTNRLRWRNIFDDEYYVCFVCTSSVLLPTPQFMFLHYFFCRAVESPVQRAYTASYSSGTN